MIHIDDRTGSKELIHYMPPQLAQLARLQFGDAMWLGEGPQGPLLIGAEVKKIDDLAASIISGRFSGHQLPGLLRDYHVVYLIIEGRFKPEPGTGLIQVPARSGKWVTALLGTKHWTHRDIAGYLTTMETLYGMRLRFSYDRDHTARILIDLHHWWQSKTWDEHASGHMFDFSGEPSLLPASPLLRIAAQLKGIGWVRAHAVAKHFSSIVDMIMAPKEEWTRIAGIGKKVAADVVEEIWKQRVNHNGIPQTTAQKRNREGTD